MITPYECKYKKMYQGFSGLGTDIKLITPRSKLGQLIDNTWHYSWHWPEGHNEWLDSARKDLEQEMIYAQVRLAELRQAEKILSLIEREAIEEG